MNVNSVNETRVELHLHTKYSMMNGLIDIGDLFNKAEKENWPAVAITDTGNIQAYPEAYKIAERKGIKLIYGLDVLCFDDTVTTDRKNAYPITVLVQKQSGIKNLYELISLGSEYGCDEELQIRKSSLVKYREGLLIGSGGASGELFTAVADGDIERAKELVRFFDYIEIQPFDNYYKQLFADVFRDEIQFKKIILTITILAKIYNKPLVAACEPRYLEPDDDTAYYVLESTRGDVPPCGFPPYHYWDTEEMLEEFSFLELDDAYNAVVTNTNIIADSIEDNIKPIPTRKHIPVIEGADEEITTECFKQAKKLYGAPLPEPVETRLNLELDYIKRSGFAALYAIARRLAARSKENGHPVISRGLIGTSLAAYLLGITQVNPLPGHYLCSCCKHSEFPDSNPYTGYDLKEKDCPVCGAKMKRVGFNIPAETFFGLDGEKEPDIELNFAGEYYNRAVSHLREIFGEDYILRGGMVLSISEITARAYLENYLNNTRLNISEDEYDRIVDMLTGVKYYNMAHSGCYFVIPPDNKATDFTPVDTYTDGVKETHFPYMYLNDSLIRIGVLGHNAPTILHDLQEETGVDCSEINLDDSDILQLYKEKDTAGLPESGNPYSRKILEELNVESISTLIKMSGFIHGTGVWDCNAEILVDDSSVDVNDIISLRDDIFLYLLSKGASRTDAFRIMEFVRKGKFCSVEAIYRSPNQIAFQEEIVRELEELKTDDWYISSMESILYLFPKAHAASYIIMDLQLAWFKINYPAEFFAAMLNRYIDDEVITPDDLYKERNFILGESEKPSQRNNTARKDMRKRERQNVLNLITDAKKHGITFVPCSESEKERTDKVFQAESGNTIQVAMPTTKL